MKEQNLSNHTRWVPLYHFGMYTLCLILIAGSALSFYRHFRLAGSTLEMHPRLHSNAGMLIPALLFLGSILILLVTFYARSFALKAQDRAIRAEENLRYFAMTGNLLDSRLTMGQVVALRFAPNNEMADLAHAAAEKGLTPKQIKESIKNWKADYNRV